MRTRPGNGESQNFRNHPQSQSTQRERKSGCRPVEPTRNEAFLDAAAWRTLRVPYLLGRGADG